MRVRLSSLSALLLALPGCNGQIYHGSVNSTAVMTLCRGSPPQSALEADHGGLRCGVPFLPLQTVLQRSKFTSRTDASGNIIGAENGLTSDGRRVNIGSPIEFSQIITITDASNPQIIWYQPAFLEAVQFSVGLNQNGSIQTVGGQFTPDRGETARNVAAAVENVAQTVAALRSPQRNLSTDQRTSPPEAAPACNAGPQVIDVGPVPRNNQRQSG